MSEDNKQEDDHSIEDILASIRSIIADDDADEPIEEGEGLELTNATSDEDDAVSDSDVDMSKPEVDPIALELTEGGDEDILELTDDMVEETPQEEPQSQDDIDALFDENVEANEDPVVEPEPVQEEPEAVDVDIQEAPEPDVEKVDLVMQDLEEEATDSLLSEAAATSAAGALSKLSENVGTESHSQNIAVGMITLEEIVRQEVRPLIKSWLDDNLPSLVERLVEKEISNLKNKL